jgi:hypothetical protein
VDGLFKDLLGKGEYYLVGMQYVDLILLSGVVVLLMFALFHLSFHPDLLSYLRRYFILFLPLSLVTEE